MSIRKGKVSIQLSLRLVCLLTLCLIAVTDVWGQSGTSPSRTQCKQWDDAFLSLFNWAVVGSSLITLALSLMSGFLGRVFWIAAAPYKRIVVVGLTCLLAVTVGIPFGPWVFGLGRLWFGGVDPMYFDCAGIQFGANGLLGGIISPGIPAVTQWPVMLLALSGSTVLGGFIAGAISGLINARIGVRSSVKEGAL